MTSILFALMGNSGTFFHSAVAIQFIAIAFVRTLSYEGFLQLKKHKHSTFQEARLACYQAHLGSANDTHLPVPKDTPIELEYRTSDTSGPVSIASHVESIIEGPLLSKNGDAPQYRCKVWTSHIIPIDPGPDDFQYLKLGSEDIPDDPSRCIQRQTGRPITSRQACFESEKSAQLPTGCC